MVRVSSALLAVALTALAGFALSAQRGVVEKARSAHAANRLARVYDDARFWVGQNESLERKYRVEPSAEVLAQHEQAGDNLEADLHRAASIDRSVSTRRAIARILFAHVQYEKATQQMFAATLAGNRRLTSQLDHTLTDPVFIEIERYVFGRAEAATRVADKKDAQLTSAESSAFNAGVLAIFLALVLVGAMGLVVRRYRRAGRKMRAAELARLSTLVVTDPLTELRNHRAFHEDLRRELTTTGSNGAPLTLVLLDVDDLRSFNNTYGHQAGDEHLRALAAAIVATQGPDGLSYRIGGDEFAVILTGAGAWAGFEYAQRLQAVLERREGPALRATAGIAQAREPRSKDELVRDADRALVSAKRSGEAAALFTPDMQPFERSAELQEDEYHIRTLADALALAVDAKDSYTQSHSQTVSNLCAAIATDLGYEPEEVSRVRIAGLLHDVGKIGIPDAILRKPGKLTSEEFEHMKTHAALGANIILAADMPERARWVRHHHERIDGSGYPDGLAGEEIPREARVIHVADAFEAMLSDRPYRKAPGKEFAITQLRTHAGTQFDRDVVEALLRVLGEPALDAEPTEQELA
ncbi:MAG: bifunctional diguanylate cyclase/phosphohydrolase [Solirubrobacteraceae bacterium]